jgi:hypothetical protein
MERLKFEQVKGKLTDTIVEDLETKLKRRLSIIWSEPFSKEGLSESEAGYVKDYRSLDFFNPKRARFMADCYNFLQLVKSSPEEIDSLIGKLFIPKEYCINNQNQPRLVIAAPYLLSTILGIVRDSNYTTAIEPRDGVCLKLVQALHPIQDGLARRGMRKYNQLQVEGRKKCASEDKLKQIVEIGTKYGYGITLK